GHVGVYCQDWERMRDFYSGFLGLKIADEDLDRGVCFLSAAPETEHHELVLIRAKDSGQKTNTQQISFTVRSLAAVRDFHHRLVEKGMKIDRTVTNGNACSVYFFDPEDNRVELYFTTPYKVRQPMGEHIDWGRTDAELLAFAQSFEEKKGPRQGRRK